MIADDSEDEELSSKIEFYVPDEWIAKGRIDAIQRAFDVSSRREQYRFMHIACRHGMIEVLKLGLQHGFNFRTTSAGKFPLSEALIYGQLHVVDWYFQTCYVNTDACRKIIFELLKIAARNGVDGFFPLIERYNIQYSCRERMMAVRRAVKHRRLSTLAIILNRHYPEGICNQDIVYAVVVNLDEDAPELLECLLTCENFKKTSDATSNDEEDNEQGHGNTHSLYRASCRLASNNYVRCLRVFYAHGYPLEENENIQCLNPLLRSVRAHAQEAFEFLLSTEEFNYRKINIVSIISNHDSRMNYDAMLTLYALYRKYFLFYECKSILYVKKMCEDRELILLLRRKVFFSMSSTAIFCMWARRAQSSRSRRCVKRS